MASDTGLQDGREPRGRHTCASWLPWPTREPARSSSRLGNDRPNGTLTCCQPWTTEPVSTCPTAAIGIEAPVAQLAKKKPLTGLFKLGLAPAG
jgi:hypothetical protein